ncbi:N-acetylglucosamine-6-phosphate deacetylase [Ornithinimicrobium sp. F0845]|uniref:N-acetylglucosamine-6-phosphate deacetylase n=1 Tax=Ornithinimicrobium sp. F0845 TaxID=2926412 RepID=UPI001FF15A83|nr:N-acetylglucosamine-6-phosphate deacetylase [Ornithinimicrobium sp. F0845]MCK0112443.1 N-acetylglucosamine-6-phosphate deacetylase [Ornithinimicrobium sp. F0845]
MIVSSERLLGPDGSFAPGWVRVDTDRGLVAEIGAGQAPGPVDVTGEYVVPGLVDIHCHGGSGASFATTDPEEARAALALHHRHGTTSVVGSLVTAGPEELERQVAALVPLAEGGEITGIHLEGPWLSPLHRGAHDPGQLRPPTREEVERLLHAARGHLRMVTIAPELPGAMEAISLLRQAGVVVAVGHTDCDADGLREAVRAGASVVTHLCNAMRPIHHRDPGPIPAALAEEDLTVELIVDGVHVHPEVVSLLHRASRARVALVTDAMAAAGCPDGSYELGSLAVEVVDGVARLEGSDSLAGSTLTLARAVRTARAAGIPTADTLVAATSTPARALGLDRGTLAPGAPADLLTLDEDLVPTGVWRAGQLLS